MRRIFQFDGLSSGALSVGECAEPEQVLLRIEREGATADLRLTREEWRNLMGLNHTIEIRYEESTDQRLSAVQ